VADLCSWRRMQMVDDEGRNVLFHGVNVVYKVIVAGVCQWSG
jgi:hypothetical protein